MEENKEDELYDELLSEVNLANLDYERKVCLKCSDEQKKERDCCLLRGFKKRGYDWMDRAINQRKKIKILIRRCLAETFSKNNLLFEKPAFQEVADKLNEEADKLVESTSRIK